MAKAYRLTLQQWQGLSDQAKSKFPKCGAMWYNSNYHLCSCMEAIEYGEDITEQVYNSYGTWTQHHSFDFRAKLRQQRNNR